MLRRVEVLLGEARSPGNGYDRNKFFIDALSRNDGVSLQFKPISAEFFALMRSLQVRGSMRLWKNWTEFSRSRLSEVCSDNVGRYIFEYDHEQINVAIDTADGRKVHDEAALNWSDVYFKCNYWPTVIYPDKVVPIVNGNGLLSEKKIEFLKQLRSHPKNNDLVYWSRIWEAPQGGGNCNPGLEHNIRLFEALSKVDANKNLLAVFPGSLTGSRLDSYKHRLDKAGVPWQLGWGEIDSQRLWDAIASARINFLRPGNHLCISWRMMDLLCLGACVVVDGAPFPQWPESLRNGVNFVDANCTFGADYSLPDASHYISIKETVEALLDNPVKLDFIAKNNANYFDQHASMESVAAYVDSVLTQRYPEPFDMALSI